MTDQLRPGKYDDYLHALAFRVLHEERLLQPRRASLFESEVAGSEVNRQLQDLSAVEPEQSQTTLGPALEGTGALSGHGATRPEPGPERPASAEAAPATVPHLSIFTATPSPRPDPAPSPNAQPSRPAELTPAASSVVAALKPVEPVAPPRPPVAVEAARIISTLLRQENPSPGTPQSKPALLPAQVVRVPMPPAVPAPAHPASPQLAAVPPQVRPLARVATSPPAPATVKTAVRRDPQTGALVAYAVPEMLSLAPLFSSRPAPKDPPSVEITIGRLEIRAATAKAASAAPRTVPTPARATLKEYLTRKAGARP